MVLNVFFYHQSISYDAWMKSPIDLEKKFLRLKIRPKVTPGGTFTLGFRCKNFRKFFRPKIISKDTLGSGCFRPKMLGRYMHSLGT